MHSYAYVADSRLDETRRALGLQTSGGRAPNPRFFTGFLGDSQQAATALLAIAKIAGTRYFQPTTERLRDPVVTCSGDRLRFESFSGCCGVYARLDVLGAALDGEVHDRGTTNVDVNEPLRRALARVTAGDPLHLTVGPDSVEVGTLDGAVVEKKVPLPPRWLRGFAETQVLTSRFDLKAELAPTEAARFLRTLPKGRAAVWAVPSGKSLRLSGSASAQRRVPGRAEPAGDAGSVAALRESRQALRAARHGEAGGERLGGRSRLATADARAVARGEPRAVRRRRGAGRARGRGRGHRRRARSARCWTSSHAWTSRISRTGPGSRTSRVKDALAQLGTAGRVGYDLAEAAYFHRELPYDGADVQAMNPRLRNAKALVEQGAVKWDGDTALVGDYRINGETCTCAWWVEYRGGRGKCKHVLAADMVRGTGVNFDDIRALIKADHAADLGVALAGVDPARHKELAAELVKYEREHRRGDNPWHLQNTLAVAGAALLPNVSTLAPWLVRNRVTEHWQHPEQDPISALIEVLSTARPAVAGPRRPARGQDAARQGPRRPVPGDQSVLRGEPTGLRRVRPGPAALRPCRLRAGLRRAGPAHARGGRRGQRHRGARLATVPARPRPPWRAARRVPRPAPAGRRGRGDDRVPRPCTRPSARRWTRRRRTPGTTSRCCRTRVRRSPRSRRTS